MQIKKKKKIVIEKKFPLNDWEQIKEGHWFESFKT